MTENVLLVVSSLEYGGAQRQVLELAMRMDTRRYAMHICSFSDYNPLAKDFPGVGERLHVVRKAWKFDATVVPRLAGLARRINARILHGYLFDAEIATRLAKRLVRRAIVIGAERNSDYQLKTRQLVAYRLTRGSVDFMIANSAAGAEFNSRITGIDRSRYQIVYNGVNTERFRPREKEKMKHELGLEAGVSYIGMFASFKKQKNHPMAFRAMKTVFDRLPNVKFLLVGGPLYGGMHDSDNYYREMLELVGSLGISERCVFLGNRHDVEKLYGACDLTILPSLYEGTPNVLLESMAAGVPVIATDVADNAKLVPNGQTGYVVEVGDVETLANRVLLLLQDENLLWGYGRKAREWAVREFTTARMVEKTAEVYDLSTRSCLPK